MADELTLADRIRATLDDRERLNRGTGILGWLTYRNDDGSMHHTAAASKSGDHWIVDGREATGWASAQVVHDEDRERRELAAHRKILDLHPSDGQDEPLCDGCGGSFHWPCPTLQALGEACGVEVNA